MTKYEVTITDKNGDVLYSHVLEWTSLSVAILSVHNNLIAPLDHKAEGINIQLHTEEEGVESGQ